MSDCDGTGNIVRSIDKYAQKEYNYEYEGGKVTHSTVYDGEERITKVIDSFDGITEYEYDALGQLKTETVNGTVVNNMTYDNYGNITEKNGVVYQYGNAVWKDLLTQVGTGANSTITYDANGNPTTYLGHTLTWEKGRQLKKFDSIEYTYNANGIRTSKKGNGVLHTYTIDGTKILRETWGENTLVPLYDNEDSVCGVLYNSVSYYFVKNLQGDVIAITDANGAVVARYTYDAWGVPTIKEDTSGCNIATVNPFRYRGYYYDAETNLYYLQSRYYDPEVGRFINADDIDWLDVSNIPLSWNWFAYCNNSTVNGGDYNGHSWYQTYAGYKISSKGFFVNADIKFLSRTFCLSYARDFLKSNGTWHWYGRTYAGMGAVRIAQEIWFHALVYYIGSPIKIALKAINVSWEWLNDKIERAREIEVNYDDDRAFLFAIVWWAGFALKTAICRRLPLPYWLIASIIL